MKMAAAEGGPMYCLMSALSTKATSILSVMLEVVRITTLQCLKTEEHGSAPKCLSDSLACCPVKLPAFGQRPSRLQGLQVPVGSPAPTKLSRL